MTSLWSEKSIARAIALQTLAKKCVVLVDNCNWTGYECDVLGVTTDLRVIDVEVKISRADLKADARKDKWWQRNYAEGSSVARLYPPKVWKHYYAMPADIWKPELVDCLPSPASGVLLLSKTGATKSNPDGGVIWVKCVRRATPSKDAARLKPEQVMDIARLANLRMWEAYHRRDVAQGEARHWYQQVISTTGGRIGYWY